MQCAKELNLRIQCKCLQSSVGSLKTSTANSKETVLILTSELSESAVYHERKRCSDLQFSSLFYNYVIEVSTLKREAVVNLF